MTRRRSLWCGGDIWLPCGGAECWWDGGCACVYGLAFCVPPFFAKRYSQCSGGLLIALKRNGEILGSVLESFAT